MNDGIRHLLEYATKQRAIGREATSAELHSIAEVIDREMRNLRDERDHWMELAHQWEAGASARGFAERLEAAASERADVTLFGVDYTPLPVDADGVPIHVGDVMEADNGTTFEVEHISLYQWGWRCDGEGTDRSGVTCTAHAIPDGCRHHHAPTVEDVLADMFAEYFDVDGDPHKAAAKVITEYAAKLRLAGDE